MCGFSLNPPPPPPHTHTYTHTCRQTDRQTDRQRYRQTDIHTHSYRLMGWNLGHGQSSRFTWICDHARESANEKWRARAPHRSKCGDYLNYSFFAGCCESRKIWHNATYLENIQPYRKHVNNNKKKWNQHSLFTTLLENLRGAWRSHCFPAPFSWFSLKTGLKDLKITSSSCFSLKCQRKDTKNAKKNTASFVASLGTDVQPRSTVQFFMAVSNAEKQPSWQLSGFGFHDHLASNEG